MLPLVLVAILLPQIGCRGAPVEPTLSVPHPRVVSLLPNATEIVFALGAQAHMVGATRYCDRPDEARTIPRVGGILDVSVEAVIGTRPDVVIGSPAMLRGRLRDLLESSGTTLVPLTFETPESIAAGIETIGRVLGRDREATDLVARHRASLDDLRGAAKRDPPIRVLLVVGRAPLVVAARSSFMGDLLDRMGVENVAGSSMIPFPTWSLEQVLKAAPDVVVDAAVEAGDLGRILAEAGVDGARPGRLVRLEDEAFLRPGPFTGPAAADLAKRIVEAARGRQAGTVR
jgi:iron complex transport system substrate-binding protein